ncbi:excinuclease ABC subunit UvrA [archaeon]|jgi:excinuclease ABC subunit A|nr:excinuclease ABC subunit UvrA [archaeon]MBT7128578.1 excinuclease ABC subunit UvrA [archaeon]
MKKISIKGAREHNLKDVSIDLPREKFVVITGLSGSGKSTLAFDTLYAEGQRRYVESLSAYARQFLGVMNKPDVDAIEGLSPAISIEQKTTSKNPRSTVGTVTEIYDYLRLLFARVGTAYCPEHGCKIESSSPQRISDRIGNEVEGNVTILAPIVSQKKGTHEQVVLGLNRDGWARVRVDGVIYRTDETIKMARYKKHDIAVVVDRVNVSDSGRLSEAVENAARVSEGGMIEVMDSGEKLHVYSTIMACPECGLAFEELQPRMFSFNSPFGACEECHGLGVKTEFDPELIIPDEEDTIVDGAIKLYGKMDNSWRIQQLGAVGKSFGFDIMEPVGDMSEEQYEVLMYGSERPIHGKWSSGASMNMEDGWEGLIPQSERLYKKTESDYRRRLLEKFQRARTCPECEGKRLQEKILSVKVAKHNINDITEMSIIRCSEFFEKLKLTSKEMEIAKLILKEIRERLSFLNSVGLGYLNLSRKAGTLSGGEAQRIRLATQIGANLMGVMYVLDEPSIGLHQRDNAKLISTLHRLRDLGNSLIVVEHDEDTIRAADFVVDIGPGAGVHGGEIVAAGTPKQIEKNKDSLTGKYLSGEMKIETPMRRRASNKYINIRGARENNLKNINVKVPIGVMNCITGVSGSGKSTLMNEILYKGMAKKLGRDSKIRPGKHKEITLDERIDKVIVINQSPIGKTPRSNPATYVGVFDEIRKLFSGVKESKIRGYMPGRFSFNVPGGRCEKCRGDGVEKIEMHFLPDVYVQCDECKGKRYNRDTLDIMYKGKNVADVLDLSVEEALEVFENVPSIYRKLETLKRVGLEYIKLGQSATTLSGGESQRIKLTKELAKRGTGQTLYILDEPTTGLHFADVKKLLRVLDSLVEKGNTMVVIEHNLDVVKSADYIIDLGPEGGEGGGRVVAKGSPEEVAKVRASATGEYLGRVL